MAALPKKSLLLAVVAAAGYLGYRRMQEQQQADQDLWAEATDQVPGRDTR